MNWIVCCLLPANLCLWIKYSVSLPHSLYCIRLTELQPTFPCLNEDVSRTNTFGMLQYISPLFICWYRLFRLIYLIKVVILSGFLRTVLHKFVVCGILTIITCVPQVLGYIKIFFFVSPPGLGYKYSNIPLWRPFIIKTTLLIRILFAWLL